MIAGKSIGKDPEESFCGLLDVLFLTFAKRD
jgi:hypothetical protein